jgi:hypothetical protein
LNSIALHILDILQNSVRAGAKNIEVSIKEDTVKDEYIVSVKDDGAGMSKEMLEKAIDPFFTTRTTRKVGLGLPLLKQNAERTGGYFRISSELGKGTNVIACFVHSNIDRPELGDIGGSLVLTISSYPQVDFLYSHVKDGAKYIFDTKEIKAVLENVSLTEPKIIGSLKEMIEENLKDIGVDLG